MGGGGWSGGRSCHYFSFTEQVPGGGELAGSWLVAKQQQGPRPAFPPPTHREGEGPWEVEGRCSSLPSHPRDTPKAVWTPISTDSERL